MSMTSDSGPQPSDGRWSPTADAPPGRTAAPRSPGPQPAAASGAAAGAPAEPPTGTPTGPPAPSHGDGGDDQGSVSGTVTRSDGSPVAGVAVRAYDRDLRREEPLGPYAPQFTTETRTDATGRYLIPYRVDQFIRAERASADLVVRAYDSAGQVAAASPIVFNAPRAAVVDLVVAATGPGLPTEYERLVAAILPLLDSPDAHLLATLRADDAEFLTGETGQPAERIRALLVAVGLLRSAAGAPAAVASGFAAGGTGTDGVPGGGPNGGPNGGPDATLLEPLYGLVRLDGGTTTWDTLGHRGVADLTAALESAAANGCVTAAVGAAAERLAARIAALAATVRQHVAAQAAPLAQPAVRWSPTGTAAANPILDRRLDDELAARIRRVLGPLSPALAAAAGPVLAGLDWHHPPATTVADSAIRVLRTAAAAEPAIAAEATALAARIAGDPTRADGATVADALHLDLPVADNPLLAADVRAGLAAAVAPLAGIRDDGLQAVVGAAEALFAARDAGLRDLVAAQALTPDEAARLDTLLDVSGLTDHNLPLLQALAARPDFSAPALAGWDAGHWQQVLGTGVPLPPGQTAAGYAEHLATGLELAYPTQALTARLAPADQSVLRLLAANPGIDLRRVDLATAGADGLDWRGVGTDAHARVRAELRRYQRLLALADTTADRAALAARGYDSALAIANRTEDQFVADSGLATGVARQTYARAQAQALMVAHLYGAAHDVIAGPWKNLPVGNTGAAFIDDLRKIDGMDRLFGSQDFCECGDCQSVLSPAAYFVDLMHFTQVNVSNPTFVAPNLTTHPLYLKVRRPDLWTLKLTCDNTNTLIPYLEIVDEVLEGYLGKVLGQDPYRVIADPANKASCQVPFSLPYAELGLYLGYFSLQIADVYQLLHRPDAVVHRARAGLSADEATVVTTADPAGVVTRLGLASAAALADLPVTTFTRRTGLTRDQLTAVLASRYDPDLGQVTVAKQPVPTEIQNFPEVLQNLTAARADRVHRLVRLLRVVPWPFPDLDLILLAAAQASLIAAAPDAGVVDLLGRLRPVATAWSLSAQQLAALIGDMPVSASFPVPPARRADRLLYEQIFDLTAIFGTAVPATGEIHQTVDYYHYSLDGTLGASPPVIDPKTPLLLAGLGIGETDLLLLFDLLKAQLPFSATGHCTLDRTRLSLLYRHVLAARALGLSVADLIALLELCFAGGGTPLTSLAQIETLVGTGAWLAGAPAGVDQLQMIVSGVESAGVRYRNTVATTSALVLSVQAAAAPGGPAPDPVATLRAKLGTQFTVGADRLADMLAWTGLDTAAPAIRTALAATFTGGVPDHPADLQPLLDLLRRLERVALLFAVLQSDDATVHYLTGATAALGVADRTAPTLADVKALIAYTTFATRTVAPQPPTAAAGSTSGSGTDAAALTQSLLTAYAGAGTYAPADRAALATLLVADRSLVDSVVEAVPLPPVPIDALSRVAEVLAACVRLGVNAYSLQKLGLDADFDALSGAAQVAAGAIAAQYPDESSRDTALEPYADKVNAARRDALCGYLIDGRPELNFRGHDDLYDYFLLDVDMSGCGRTSRVVAATNSVQLYVQRCQTGLEVSDPAIVSVPQIAVSPSAVPAAQWAWRQNFRVWQANRKVFLYPEAYLDPELRDDKTPAFDDLADELSQKQITDDTAEDAYATYLTELADLAHLKIAGSHYDAASHTYYFFGRTRQDPPVFYYRTWDTTTWSSWQTIDLPIDGPYVSAAIHLGRLYVFWVDGTTKDHTTISGGSSVTDYYTARVSLAYSSLKPDGKWKPPQKVDWLYPSGLETISAVDEIFAGFEQTPELNVAAMELSRTYRKTYPYAAGGHILHRYYNPTLNENYYFDRRLDLFHNRLTAGSGIPGLAPASPLGVYAAGGTAWLGVESGNYGTEVDFDLTREQPDAVATSHTHVTTAFGYTSYGDTDPGRTYIMHAVHNGYPQSVVQLGDQQFLVKQAAPGTDGPRSGGRWPNLPWPWLSTPPRRLVRLSTSAADHLGEVEAAGGLDALFALATQTGAVEQPLPFTITAPAQLAGPDDDPHHIDLRGAFGAYFQELYFHIPWTIARQLNAGGRYADAMRWFQRVFDPTAAPSAADATETDRNWRYVGFRGLTVPTMQQALSDPAALAAYANDPFNPFAIARLRPVAFQKAIVMQFVDNLLDWGDSLFAQDTMESINEATMLYVLAAEILGPRPVPLGECETADEDTLTYAAVEPALGSTSDFLVTLENWVYSTPWAAQLSAGGTVAAKQAGVVSESAPAPAPAPDLAATVLLRTDSSGVPVADPVPMQVAAAAAAAGPAMREPLLAYSDVVRVTEERAAIAEEWRNRPIPIHHAPQIVQQTTLVFCVPPDDVLTGYWDRVADRLGKIRNCMNLSGVRRQLALFAPPVNPMDLVRARAAGLSIEDALAVLDSPVPPYRFTTLIDRARGAATAAASFGAALLAALEKKDVEELGQLRSLHERTILRMTTEVKKKQVQDAQFTWQATIAAGTRIQNRIDYYQGLLDDGLNSWEVTEEVSRHLATGLRLSESVVHLSAAITYLIPQLGSPFAMKYGGQELGHSGVEFAQWTQAMAGIAEAVAGSAALEAGFSRRRQEWNQAVAQANQELAENQQQQSAASVKADAAQRELDIHTTSVDQAAEVDDFLKGKFTGLGLYTYLARTLTRLFRLSYDTAYGLALAAQKAYGFERDDDTVFIAPDNWEGDRAGLLSGERLSLQLQQMESAYLLGNTRRYEVTQAFPLSLVAPSALLALRETGTCSFDLPEILFDVIYPGHYRRTVKSVRVTVPGVVGPYNNVGAKLSMTASSVRPAPGAPLAALPAQPNIASAIATSTGLNDGGLFELTFRDERYLPFEGTGAVSSWRLELPAQLRAFDYQTISDVVLHVSYTALDDAAWRTTVETGLVGQFTAYAGSTGLYRLLSLRHDFPDAWNQLFGGTANPAGVGAKAGFAVTPQHFPYFLAQHAVNLDSVQVLLMPAQEAAGGGPAGAPVTPGALVLSVNGTTGSAWTTLAGTDLTSSTVPSSGAAVGPWTLAVTAGAVDPAKVGDVVMLVKYKV